MIYSQIKTRLKHLSVLENEGSPIFHNSGDGYEVIDCTIPLDQMSLSSETIFIDEESKPLTGSFINRIPFIITGECQNNPFFENALLPYLKTKRKTCNNQHLNLDMKALSPYIELNLLLLK